MKLGRLALAILLAGLLLTSTLAQGPQPPPVTTQQVKLVLQNPPSVVPSVSVSRTGNPGPQTYFYWIVANYLVGSSSPAGPFIAQNAPNTLDGSNFFTITWQSAVGATTYDVLRTTTRSAPVGACACAVATAISGNSTTDQSNNLNAYTVSVLDPNTLTVTLGNEPTAAGVSHLILRQNAVQVADLSAGLAFPLLAPDGSAAAPPYSFLNSPGSGWFMLGGQLRASVGGNHVVSIVSGLLAAPAFCMDATISNDVCFNRDAANVQGQRNGTNAQISRVYKTFTDLSNYARATIDCTAASACVFGAENAGTGPTTNVILSAPTSGQATIRVAGLNQFTCTASNCSFPIGVGNSGGFQHFRTATGCATAASAGATCDVTVTWPSAFTDANYTPQCGGFGVTSGVPSNGAIVSKVAASLVFRTVAVTAAAAQFTNIYCTAAHD